MRTEKIREFFQELLAPAGVAIGGTRPWDITVTDDRFYSRVMSGGSLGLGESYMDGWWECESIDEFFDRILPTGPERKVGSSPRFLLQAAAELLFNKARKSRAFQVGKKHYDIGNDLFERMLDKRMVYTCAYWKDSEDLDSAQEAKLDLICRKLDLKPGDRVLDIGCGWGSFLKFASERYGAEAVGVTVSREQAAYASEKCVGLPVEVRLQDYRDVAGEFDHIVSLGMFEHVGYKNYGVYMQKAHGCLKDNGLLLLHTIGNNETQLTTDRWMAEYIFPNSHIPSMRQITTSIEGLFMVEDWHGFGPDYDTTLMAWHRNFADSWSELKGRYDERFQRMWNYYLLSCAGTFRSRGLQLWQVVLSKKGLRGAYRAPR